MVTGLAKRDGYWARQAGWLLSPPSGIVAGPAKRDDCWARQAGRLLGPPSGVMTRFRFMPRYRGAR
ncbi:hypothetical protein HMPREF9080_02193 [Cardiobacterium valvarum F0432]|uniref:Uncharacterized protein n=1 Tax=Cardiobacterium valvarum F0432 TaxID=797473 RepID=G9ZHG3_9GAMM|nr:hypothetical protein HMPREF9080_02193 [Cardiobacterium valvarum F0432]